MLLLDQPAGSVEECKNNIALYLLPASCWVIMPYGILNQLEQSVGI